MTDFRKIAEELWQLLDDIDTASDMFKPTNEVGYRNFYNYAMRKQGERFKYLKSDGYKLYTDDEWKNYERRQKLNLINDTNRKISKNI
jgi:hypothetical protein